MAYCICLETVAEIRSTGRDRGASNRRNVRPHVFQPNAQPLFEHLLVVFVSSTSHQLHTQCHHKHFCNKAREDSTTTTANDGLSSSAAPRCRRFDDYAVAPRTGHHGRRGWCRTREERDLTQTHLCTMCVKCLWDWISCCGLRWFCR